VGVKSKRTAVAVLVASALALGACGDDEESTEPAASGGMTEAPADSAGEDVQSGDVALEIVDFAFVPEQVTVEVGSTITWTNIDTAVHTATADDGSFDTGNLQTDGGEGEVTFDSAGTFTYFCQPHPFMNGKVKVVE